MGMSKRPVKAVLALLLALTTLPVAVLVQTSNTALATEGTEASLAGGPDKDILPLGLDAPASHDADNIVAAKRIDDSLVDSGDALAEDGTGADADDRSEGVAQAGKPDENSGDDVDARSDAALDANRGLGCPDMPIEAYAGDASEEAFVEWDVDSYDQISVDSLYRRNGLTVGDPDRPSTWSFAIWEYQDTRYPRLAGLDLRNLNLHGSLDGIISDSIKNIDCSNNQLTGISIVNLPKLESLDCSNNPIKSLTTIQDPALTSIRCENAQIDDLGLYQSPVLRQLYCGGNKLKSLNLSYSPMLTEVRCNDNNLTRGVDAGGNPQLKILDLRNNNMDYFSTWDIKSLAYFDCSDNPLRNLDLSSMTDLITLRCYNLQLTKLDLTGLTNLESLACAGNPIRSFVAPDGAKLAVGRTDYVMLGEPDDENPQATGNFGYDVSTKAITMTTKDGPYKTFEHWAFDSPVNVTDNTAATDKKVSFILDKDIETVPWFNYFVSEHPGTYTGSGDAVFRIEADHDYYLKTTVDGVEAPIPAAPGSTVLTFPASYLAGLPDGVHAVSARYTDGHGDAALSIDRNGGGGGGGNPDPVIKPGGGMSVSDGATLSALAVQASSSAIVAEMPMAGDTDDAAPWIALALASSALAAFAYATVRRMRGKR